MGEPRERREQITFFLTGCLIGMLCFVAVYGVRILNVTYDAWLLNGELDLMQHYVGWGHYRNSPWTFPIGLITTLSKPYAMSVIYTDSIPLVAVICKCISPILPETFQYFGLYGCFSFALQGGCSMVLLHRFIRRRWLVVLASFFFILSFPILQRMYYHTALASQWLILLAFLIWFYEHEDTPLLKKCLKWGAMGFLCVSIHSYFLPMCGAILLFSVIDACIVAKKKTGKIISALMGGCAQIVSFCLLAICNLWLLGAFTGGASAIGGGIGTFESNLNTFYNPLGFGITGISLPLYYEFQYEGFAYLGLGLLMLSFALILVGIGLLFIRKSKIRPLRYFREHHRQALLLILLILFILLSCGPIYTWNAHRIIVVPLPGFIGKLADIFRSNGRMIWVSLYLCMLGIFVLVDRIERGAIRMVAMLLALALQITDLGGEIPKKQAYFNREQSYQCMFEDPKMQQIMGDKTEFIIMDSTTMMMMEVAYYAQKHHLATNRFYYARNIDPQVEAQTEIYREELRGGKTRASAVYIFKKEGFVNAAYPELVCYEIGEHIMGVKQK